ncbi:MAG: DNA mismatch repair protein MutS [Sphingobacteriales bacterium]
MAKKEKGGETPLMKQYNSFKAKYPDAILLFRVGDFYETFGKDAIIASKVLGIVLTKRKNGAASDLELAGFPYHSMDTYLPKLVRAGYRVAIVDQLEDAKLTKTIVKRGVTELVTPGVTYNDKVLDHNKNNFLAALFGSKAGYGVAFLDISTGEFLVAEGSFEYIDKLLQGFAPAEIVAQKQVRNQIMEKWGAHWNYHWGEDWVFSEDYAEEKLLDHFKVSSLKGYGVEHLSLAKIAAGAIMYYLGETHHSKLNHIVAINRVEQEHFVWLDRFTIRNLELISSPHEGATTLIDVLDKTCSPMGSRTIRRWTVLPLKELSAIQERLEVVKHFVNNTAELEEMQSWAKCIGDMERLVSKVAVGRVNPREVLFLNRALKQIDPIQAYCKSQKGKIFTRWADQFNGCSGLVDKIEKMVNEDAPLLVSKGGVIKSGINQELDDLRSIAYNGKDHLLKIQERETELTGIPSLKIAYNNVFGYYLEVRNMHKDKVPPEWDRKQTLVNAERYITEELKVLESKILGAEDKIQDLENQLFSELVREMAEYVPPIQLNATLIGSLDALMSFAEVSIQNEYVCPEVNEGTDIDIVDGRHPVIEHQLGHGQEYVSNSVQLNKETQQIMMITGPNMSGKSALLRQTALISLMAQMGCFVPAKSAKLGILDKIFTRVGASDNISSGESTFMVEMNETASILNNVSDRSLILLDEIGRGTSTYDGISIAWAISEFLHENGKFRPKTLFATHYHELNNMADKFDRIKNFNVSVQEKGGRILFLRKLKPGGSEHSFGIQVAAMAGMPPQVLKRAKEVLRTLERDHSSEEMNNTIQGMDKGSDMQLSFFQLDDPVLSQIRDEIIGLDIDTLTPVEALLKLHEIKKLTGTN